MLRKLGEEHGREVGKKGGGGGGGILVTVSKFVDSDTLLLKNIGKLADFTQQFTVCDLHRIPWFISFPTRMRLGLIMKAGTQGQIFMAKQQTLFNAMFL